MKLSVVSKVSTTEFHDVPSKAGMCACYRGPRDLRQLLHLSFFVVQKTTDCKGLQMCPPAWSRSKYTCAIPDRLSHSSWAVSKPVKKIQGKADCRAHCCGMSSVALWSCLQATYRHKISSLVNKTTKSKKILENFLV